MKVSATEQCEHPLLKNVDCVSESSPQLCPNSWQYLDNYSTWKMDTQIEAKCGKPTP